MVQYKIPSKFLNISHQISSIRSAIQPNEKLRLDNLDDYSLLGIFDLLGFDELLNLSEVNDRFHQLIGNHYMLGKYNIDVKIVRLDLLSTQLAGYDEYRIGRYYTIQKFLKSFGHLVKKLKFLQPAFDDHRSGDISIQIAEYCSKTLNEIEVANTEVHLLSKTKQTFQNVNSVNIAYHNRIQRANELDNLQINRIYPNMDKLSFAAAHIGLTSIAQKYPHLKHLEFHDSFTEEHESLEELIHLNPQLCSLTLTKFPRHAILQLASNNLLKLDTLALSEYPSGGLDSYKRTVHFHNVKKFVFTINRNDSNVFDIVPVTFQQLEVLEIVTATSFNAPIQLIEQNKQLKKLSMPFTNIDVLDTFRDCSAFEEIKFRWSNRISALDTIRLLCKLTSLKKITFVVLRKQNIHKLFEAMQKNWKFIEETQTHSFRNLIFSRDYSLSASLEG